MAGRLQGKKALVTGAASGIGQACARVFAREGAQVFCVDRNEADLERTMALLETDASDLKSPDRSPARYAVADAGDEGQMNAVIDQAHKIFGGLDVLMPNAGISGGTTSFLDYTPQMFFEILRVNLLGIFIAIRKVAPSMIAQGGGSIICTASVAGLRANAGGAPYSASKAGVISLVQTAANAFAGSGVRVNAICPGLIETGMTQILFDYARERGTQDKIGQLNPLRRAGRPEEIANMALFLASDEASYVNGQAFPVDGGLSSTLPFSRVHF